MNYNLVAPKDTFISDYMKYMQEVETSSSYDFWCALWAIGVGIGREVYVDRPRAPVYHNWYVVLAADSGTTRKSTAIRSIISIVGSHPEINLITAKTTPTGFMEDLALRGQDTGVSTAHLAFTEMVTILGQEGYMKPMVGLLTDFYDCPEERLGPGNFSHRLNFKKLYVSFISASTPTWLATDINPSVIEGGFTSRVIFVVDERAKRLIAWPKKEDVDERERVLAKYTGLINERRVGPIKINAKALSVFSSWYRKRDLHSDPFRSSFESREDDHILRLASCLCINDGTYEIQNGHIRKGIAVISDAKDKANLIFGSSGNTEVVKLGNSVELVRKHLVKAGMDGIPHSKLYYAVRGSLHIRDFRLLIKIMHEIGMINIYETGTKGRIYRANKSIEGVGVTQKVLSSLSPSSDQVQ